MSDCRAEAKRISKYLHGVYNGRADIADLVKAIDRLTEATLLSAGMICEDEIVVKRLTTTDEFFEDEDAWQVS